MARLKNIGIKSFKELFLAPVLEEVAFRVLMYHTLTENYIFWSAFYFSISHAHLYYRVSRRYPEKNTIQKLVPTRNERFICSVSDFIHICVRIIQCKSF